jgi:hypothetical protein
VSLALPIVPAFGIIILPPEVITPPVPKVPAIAMFVSNFAEVTASAAIFAVLIALSAILAVVGLF